MEDVTDHNPTRYQEGRFIDVALSVLYKHDVRALRLDPPSPEFRKACSRTCLLPSSTRSREKGARTSSHALAIRNLRRGIPEK